MTDRPPSAAPRRRLVLALTAGAILSLALLPLLAGPAEAGLFTPAGQTKSTASFEHGGRKITVWRYQPKAKGKHPALVMLYGMDCLDRSPARYEFIAQRFAAKGYVVNFVHYFDGTPVDPKGVGVLQNQLKACLIADGPVPGSAVVRQHFRDWVATVKAGVEYTRAQPDVDPDKVCLVGFSLGGFVAMSVLATEPDLRIAAAVECFGGLPRELRGDLKKAPPVLIFHGDKDDSVPVAEAHALKALPKEKRCAVEDRIFDGCGHMWLDKAGNLRLDRVLEAETICLRFLDRHVKNVVKAGR